MTFFFHAVFEHANGCALVIDAFPFGNGFGVDNAFLDRSVPL